MNDLFLGTIAVSVLVMAIIQVATILWAAKIVRSVGQTVSRFERDVRPVLTSLQALSADAAKATAIAASQVERADQMLAQLRQRLDETTRALQKTILGPAREGMAMLQALKEVFFSGGNRPPRADSRRRPVSEEEDALFIG